MQGQKLFITLFLILDIYYLPAQEGDVNKYGLTVILSANDFIARAEKDSTKSMAELKRLIPNLSYDLRYATTNNFMKKRMYPKRTSCTFLRLPAVYALKKAQEDLNKKGFGLKIWDAYRPYSATESFWELVKDERYVANPSKGSGHNRGIAVDLTIILLLNGRELNMGTGFDNFSDTAHHSFTNLPDEVLQNRLLLKSTMEKFGFISFPSEWWHYSLPDPGAYELLDLSFKTLQKYSYQSN
jgi:D-alanyl-D-alanine dipeptidase